MINCWPNGAIPVSELDRSDQNVFKAPEGWSFVICTPDQKMIVSSVAQ